MSPLDLSFRLALKLTPAGEQRARLAAERGEKTILGKWLPVHELRIDEDGRTRVYFVGPVEEEGGKSERLAWYEFRVGA